MMKIFLKPNSDLFKSNSRDQLTTDEFMAEKNCITLRLCNLMAAFKPRNLDPIGMMPSVA
jgi:hypothetical protein